MRATNTHVLAKSYPRDLRDLLNLGEPDYLVLPPARNWEKRHVAPLIRMMTDMCLHRLPDSEPASWAPLHAMEALGVVDPAAGLTAALGLLEPLLPLGKEHFRGQVGYLGIQGIAALPALEAYLADPAIGADSKVNAARAIDWMVAQIGGPEEEPVSGVINRLLALGAASVPAEVRSELEQQLARIEDPTGGLDPDCPLCRLMLQDLHDE